jgi:hypothetical protein
VAVWEGYAGEVKAQPTGGKLVGGGALQKEECKKEKGRYKMSKASG